MPIYRADLQYLTPDAPAGLVASRTLMDDSPAGLGAKFARVEPERIVGDATFSVEEEDGTTREWTDVERAALTAGMEQQGGHHVKREDG